MAHHVIVNVHVPNPPGNDYRLVNVIYRHVRGLELVGGATVPLDYRWNATYSFMDVQANDFLEVYSTAPGWESDHWSWKLTEEEAAMYGYTINITQTLKELPPPEKPVTMKELVEAIEKEQKERMAADLKISVEALEKLQKYLDERKLWDRVDESEKAWRDLQARMEEANKDLKSIWEQLAGIPQAITDGFWALIETFVGMILSGIMSGLEEGFRSIETDNRKLEETTKVKVG
jgi:hypothetical protein